MSGEGSGIDSATLDNPGPRGALGRFLDACSREEAEEACACLTVESREGFDIHGGPTGDINAQLGEEEQDGEFVVVPTTLTVQGQQQSMPFTMRQEEGEWRLDMSATMERLMGFSPDEMLESVGEAMKSGMESMGEALASGFESMGEAMTAGLAGETQASLDPAEAGDAEWQLPIAEVPTNGTDALELIRRLGRYFEPAFTPPEDELERDDNSFEDTINVRVRYGDEAAGYILQESSGPEHLTVSVLAHGMTNGGALHFHVVQMPGEKQAAYSTATLRISGSGMTRRAVGAFLAGRFGIDDL